MRNNLRRGVEVQLVGGLGNQLFGYFVGASLAKELDTSLRLDISQLDRGLTKHGVSIKSFILEGEFVDRTRMWSVISTLFELMHQRVKRILPKAFIVCLSRNPTYTAQHLGYDHGIWGLSNGVRLRGYFQSWKYFEKYQKQTGFNSLLLKNPSKWYQEMETRAHHEKPTALHVRRGDYKKVAEDFGLLSVDFYLEACKQLSQSELQHPIWVFSDEIDAARELLKNRLPSSTQFIEPPKETDPAETLLLMSVCFNHIIANSTFSWWGAMLSKSDGVVIAPRKWFRRMSDPELLIPDNWILVDSQWEDLELPSKFETRIHE